MATRPRRPRITVRIYDPETQRHLQILEQRTDRTREEIVRIALDLLYISLFAKPAQIHPPKNDRPQPVKRELPNGLHPPHPTAVGASIATVTTSIKLEDPTRYR